MTVAAILKEKGRDVIAERGETELAEVCKVLGKNKIGAILITDPDGHIEGIVSERDIVRAVGEDGSAALTRPVSSVMTKSVVTCSEDDTVSQVMAKMTAGRFRHVPVVKDGKVAGVISIGDVVKHKIAQVEQEAEQMRSYITMA
ncbi:CBS domain protein [Roseibium hamelinense]|uniref:CBS domain protein n=1 Tax=Roseibium hamelinense TaxID=150831 RepID=A0A562TAT0_9HYPH|nr:CBS domain-containing protein [Roseibium hamelinense]MTI42241.1 CBS domain-containing protein [Roseibium hamelinense]TWI90543.1 CBS domain protein [Roseibium hamelinense]